MPQADLFYSEGVAARFPELLGKIENAILEVDDRSGECKGRAHKVVDYNHPHVLLRVSMLPKPHRDAAFAAKLTERLLDLTRTEVPGVERVNVHVSFDLVHYR